MLKTTVILSLGVLLSGCAQDNNRSTPAPHATSIQQTTDQWVGRWIGVEGLNLTLSKDAAAGPGHYLLKMQYGLDAEQSGTYKGQATADGISFNRQDGQQLLRAGDGQATGLKWLADKHNCLIVKPGEGYCRD
ncbi:hypothetical protein [Pseudomonas sp. M30-35]|uniref:hypothetical protein n=1 Tax=Pseudomonas sp. M30-35 TaxID=1981174 RepID=UPI000B3BF4B8|nr:hypothetical protein [Pseudomonas sp. M30-35]ARU87620.1 hypothetical protein B9K09_06425 [Pseudomonas sp. M30-35]